MDFELGGACVRAHPGKPGHAVTARFGDPLPPLGMTVACRIAMGAAMAFMLLIMI